MQEKTNLANKPISMGRQIMYGFCEIACNPIYTIMVSFLTFYYTDVLGINAGIIGVLILFCKIFDGITDIAAGSIIEHTHTKKGSARPWIFRFAIPLAVSVVLLFTVPDLPVVGQLIYIFVSYNFSMSICYTMYGAAANALPIYATNDVKSRGSAFAVRIAIAGVVQLVLVTFFMNWVDMLGGGSRAWIIISIVVAVISLIGSVVTYYSLPENANPDLTGGAAEKQETAEKNVPLWTSLKALLHNKYWLMLLALLACVLFHQIATLTVGVYYATWVLNDTLLAGQISLFHSGAVTVAVILAPVLLNMGISKKNICLGSTALMLIGGVLGIIPSDSLLLFYISLILRGAGYGVIAGIINGMLADSLAYGEWKTGVATPALGMCAYTFVQKVMVGVVTAAFGVILGMFGYDGLAASQPASAINFIRLFFLIFPVVLYVGQALLLKFYHLDKELPQIETELEERRAGN